MSNCPGCKDTPQSDDTPVPNFAVTGFKQHYGSDNVLSLPDDILALQLSGCVSATYDPKTNQICFHIPIFGEKCLTSPVHIPVGGKITVCFETCGGFIPKGVKVTVNLNDHPIFTHIFGKCSKG